MVTNWRSYKIEDEFPNQRRRDPSIMCEEFVDGLPIHFVPQDYMNVDEELSKIL